MLPMLRLLLSRWITGLLRLSKTFVLSVTKLGNSVRKFDIILLGFLWLFLLLFRFFSF